MALDYTRPMHRDPDAKAEGGAEPFDVVELTEDDKGWVQRTLKAYWASTVQVSRGRAIQADELPGFKALHGGDTVGLLTYRVEDGACEIVTHNALAGHGGIGSCLLNAVRQKARALDCSRLWCITTNDNTPAMRFYQRRDFNIVALHKDAVIEARRLKPEIPDVGLDGIRIRHEIEMEYLL